MENAKMERFHLTLGLIFLAFATQGAANAAVIYESATLGPTGYTGGLSLNDQWLASRFTIAETYTVTQVGGHLTNTQNSGSLFAAIVPMSGLLPGFSATEAGIEANALWSTTFIGPSASAEVLLSLSLQLVAGDYALIFGGATQDSPFGATGAGSMPGAQTDPNTADGVSSYFYRNGPSSTWNNGGFNNVRFVVLGDPAASVPVPATLALIGLGLAGLGYQRRKQIKAA